MKIDEKHDEKVTGCSEVWYTCSMEGTHGQMGNSVSKLAICMSTFSLKLCLFSLKSNIERLLQLSENYIVSHVEICQFIAISENLKRVLKLPGKNGFKF